MNGGAGYSEIVTPGTWEDHWFREDAPIPEKPALEGASVPADSLQKRCIPLFQEEECNPISYTAEPDGSILADFGEIVFGRVEVSGNGPGQIQFGYIEDMTKGWSNAEGNQEMYRDLLLDTHEAFTFKSFRKRAMRYVRVRGGSNIRVRVLEYGYPVKDLGSFRCSDERLNRLMDICVSTLKVNMDDIFNDCPHRDQSQWMDAYLSSQTALALFGDTALARKCLLQHGFSSYETGRIYSPSVSSDWLDGKTMFADYALMFFDYVLWYYNVTGETDILNMLQDNLRSVLETFLSCVDGTGLLRTEKKLDMVYLDNTFELPRKPYSAALNALFYMAMHRFGQICQILGQSEEAKLWQYRAENLQKVYFETFSHPEKEHCLKDASGVSGLGYYMVNFSCELGRWYSKGAALDFSLWSEEGSLELEIAEYTGFRLLCNGNTVYEENREPDWRRQPNYDPRRVTLKLNRGWNDIRFEVSPNQLNFELFFRGSGGRPLTIQTEKVPGYALMTEIDYATGEVLSEPKQIRLRRWVPPTLSQSTHMYACISGIYPDLEKAAAALGQIMVSEYFRTYLSVRVPYFCTEAGEDREQLPWVMPANTPWTGSFLLQALGQYGLGNLGLSMLRSFWGGMLDRGAVNTWEEWGDRSSLCHAWGATPAQFLLSRVLGVDHTTKTDGYLTIRPCLYDLAWAEGTVAVGEGDLKIYVNLKKPDLGAVGYHFPS